MADCATCRHYAPQEIVYTSDGEPLSGWQVLDPSADPEDPWPYKLDPLPWGMCALARSGYEMMVDGISEDRCPTAEQAAAIEFFPSDASSYSAALYVRPSFGCKLWAAPEADG